MATIVVCDRCESDNSAGMLNISIGVTTADNALCLHGPMSSYYRKVDLCAVCVLKLTGFLDGQYIDENFGEETPEGDSKKEKENENIPAGATVIDAGGLRP